MLSNDTPRTVALYARVSTLDQDCNLQLADLRRYAQHVLLATTSTSM
jgi:DNA invertase Pin-like site-specific DNA recombinase